MNTPEWLKPTLLGGSVGAVALAITGFTWGGWMTASTAQDMARSAAKTEVVAALVPICLAQSRQDPSEAMTLAKIKGVATYQRDNVLMEAGWATMPGSDGPDHAVVDACLDALAASF